MPLKELKGSGTVTVGNKLLSRLLGALNLRQHKLKACPDPLGGLAHTLGDHPERGVREIVRSSVGLLEADDDSLN